MAVDYTKRPASGGDQGGQGGQPVSLSKVTLTKAEPRVSLSKQAAGGGQLRVNLNWNARAGRGGLFSRNTAIDLDLGCLYEFADGSRGAVQALGGSFTDHASPAGRPVLRLDGDDRSGKNSAGENLFVDLGQVERIKRVIVFAFIYEGVPNWAAADAVVTLFPAAGAQVEVRLDDPDPRASMCGIALLTNQGGQLQVERSVRYVNGHRALDEAFGWGLSWTAGSK